MSTNMGLYVEMHAGLFNRCCTITEDHRTVQIICTDIRRYILVNSDFQFSGWVADVENITFADKLIEKVTFLINESTILKKRWKKCIRFENDK